MHTINILFRFLLIFTFSLLAIACNDSDNTCLCSDGDFDTDDCPTVDGDEEAEPDTTDGDEVEQESELADNEIEAEEEIVEHPLYWQDGQFIRDQQGRAIIIRGVNASNPYKYAPKTELPFLDEAGYKHMAALGFNTVRLITQWYAIEPEPDQYDTEYMDIVEQRVRWAAAAGLYVIIDMHQDIYGIGFNDNGAPSWTCDESYYESYEPTSPWTLNYFSDEVTACFDQFWQKPDLWNHQNRASAEMGKRVADEPLVMGYDPFNEPFWGTLKPEELEAGALWNFHNAFAETVKDALPERLIFFQPTIMFNTRLETAFPNPPDFPGVFAPHYYEPIMEIIEEFNGDAKAVRDDLHAARMESERLGSPLVFGEMGGVNSASHLDDYLDVFYGAMDKEMIGGMIWGYSIGNKGLLMDDAGTLHPQVGRVFRPTPSAVAGDPVSFFWDANNLHFELVWNENPLAGDTEITLPLWIKNGGYSITIDGNAATPALNDIGTRIVIEGGKGGQRTVTLDSHRMYAPELNEEME